MLCKATQQIHAPWSPSAEICPILLKEGGNDRWGNLPESDSRAFERNQSDQAVRHFRGGILAITKHGIRAVSLWKRLARWWIDRRFDFSDACKQISGLYPHEVEAEAVVSLFMNLSKRKVSSKLIRRAEVGVTKPRFLIKKTRLS